MTGFPSFALTFTVFLRKPELSSKKNLEIYTESSRKLVKRPRGSPEVLDVLIVGTKKASLGKAQKSFSF